MPPVVSQEDQQNKTWWSLSKSPSHKDLRHAYSQGKPPTTHTKSAGKLTSLATAIGLKPKKNFPALAIQDPPSPIVNDIPRPDTHVNIPPHTSKKQAPAKLTRSRANSTAPQTPVDTDGQRRNSLMTLSDTDPFAGRPMIVPPIPHMPPDPNRLSAHSNSPVTSVVPRRAEPPPSFNRISYASSSSNSNGHAFDSSTTSSANSPIVAQEHRPLKPKRSVPSLQVKRPDGMYRQASLTPTGYSASRPGTSPIYAASHHGSQIDVTAPLRPKMRARGMTDSGAFHRPAGFLVNDTPAIPQRSSVRTQPTDPYTYNEANSVKSPKVVIRQPSVPRMHPAPTAPPTQKLPPPPIPRTDDLSASRGSKTSSATSYTSSDSFAGTLAQSAHRDGTRNRNESDIDSVISFAQITNSRPRNLKKSTSQSSIKSSHMHGAISSSNPNYPQDISADKSSRRHRIFPHPRLPIPPIPSSTRPSTSPGLSSFPSTSESGQTLVSDKRASQSSTGRRRLFSNSSRPSTLHSASSPRDDDTQSIFSLRSDVDAHLSHFKPWLSTPKSNSASSFWDEERSDHVPNSPIFPPQDFTPQSIMSSADLEKLEATVDKDPPERISRSRPRGFSILSSSTMFSDFSAHTDMDSSSPAVLSAPPLSRPPSKQLSLHESPMRRGRQSRSGSPTPSIFFDDRSIPEAASVEPTSASSTHSSVARPSTAPNPGIMSLPPPPRRGRKATLVSYPDIPEMTVAPPIATTLPLTINKSSSIRSTSRTNVEKPSPRKPLMRKPSFLEIDDEPVRVPKPVQGHDRSAMTDSFLDMARESFDTTR